jgi:hypothetical protein
MNDKTVQLPRMPKRSPTGLLAWQATVGFISQVYSQDVALMLHAYPVDGDVRWRAGIAWGQVQAQIDAAVTLAAALRDLWPALERVFTVFDNPLDAVRAPTGYADNAWVDADSARTLAALTELSQAVFPGDWALVIVYQAVENPGQRVKLRLLARNQSVQVSGQGPSVREACRDVYRNAAPEYFHSSGKLAQGLE